MHVRYTERLPVHPLRKFAARARMFTKQGYTYFFEDATESKARLRLYINDLVVPDVDYISGEFATFYYLTSQLSNASINRGSRWYSKLYHPHPPTGTEKAVPVTLAFENAIIQLPLPESIASIIREAEPTFIADLVIDLISVFPALLGDFVTIV